jgi:hypothetical protein
VLLYLAKAKLAVVTDSAIKASIRGGGAKRRSKRVQNQSVICGALKM